MKLTALKLGAVMSLAFAAAVAFAHREDRFKEMDSNSDGRVTAAEHETAAATKFGAADANKDGSLTKGELTGFMVDEKGKSGRKAEKKSDKKISKLDANGDGVLTQQEFADGHKQMFSKADANGDGALTMEEMKEAHDRK